MKRFFSILLFIAMMFSFAACGNTNGNSDTSGGSSSDTNSLVGTEPGEKSTDNKTMIDIEIGSTVLTATLEDNSSAKAFAELLEQGEITLDMNDYGNFEKVGSLPQSIVRNDENITTQAGDVMLYQGNQITIYYDTNTYSFTKLGKINGISQEELKSLLGNGNVSVTFRLHTEETTEKKVLVVYFSATGTTKKIAEYAADAMGAELYEIVPADPYTSEDLNYNDSDCRANTEMEDVSCRPQINGSVANMEDYDTVFVGYPIWWGEAPRIVSTFIESYDFSGKTVVTFCTSGGSANNDKSIKALANGANWVTGTRLNSSSSKSEVAEWINGLGIDVSAK